jgi:hypothetical protein
MGRIASVIAKIRDNQIALHFIPVLPILEDHGNPRPDALFVGAFQQAQARHCE